MDISHAACNGNTHGCFFTKADADEETGGGDYQRGDEVHFLCYRRGRGRGAEDKHARVQGASDGKAEGEENVTKRERGGTKSPDSGGFGRIFSIGSAHFLLYLPPK